MKFANSAWSAAAVTAGVLLALPTQQASAQGLSTAAASMLEEIVVTARRREETLADLPLSVASISADAMQAQGIYNIDDVGEFVPNLTYTNTDRRHVKAIYIRGIGNDSPVSIRPTGTGVYLDGQYLPNTRGQMLSTADVERVEVMRGPQGTLFGKNTTGGAINIVTTKPSQEYEAEVLLRVGDYGTRDFKAMVNIPINDIVAGRFSVMDEVSDGQFYNNYKKTTAGGWDVNGFGAAFRITPNDNWIIDLSARANYQDDQDEGVQCRAYPNQKMYDNMVTQHGAAALANFQAYEGGVKQWGGSNNLPLTAAQTAAGDTKGTLNSVAGHVDRMFAGATLQYWNECRQQNLDGPHVTSQEKDTRLQLDNEFVNMTMEWDSAGAMAGMDNVNFKLITAKQNTHLKYFSDRDGSSLSIDALGGTGPRGGLRLTKTIELLLTVDVNEQLSFIGGYHYFDDESQAGMRSENGCLAILERNFAEFSNPASTLEIECRPDGGTQFDRLPDRVAPGGPGVTGRDGYAVNMSDAIFGHLTYRLNDDWTLDAGARYTDESRIFHQLEWGTEKGTCNHKGAGDPSASQMCDPTYLLNYKGYSGGFYNNAELNFSASTPMVSLSRSLEGNEFMQDGMFYTSISEGFLAGSFNDELNVMLEPALAPLLTYDPEYVTNYEFGFKGGFLDGRLRLSTAVFFMDYRDKQETVTIDNSDQRFGPDPSVQVTANAATVDISGIEFEARLQPWDGGFLTLDVGFLSNEYGEYNQFDAESKTTIDRSNLTIKDYSPSWTVNASIEHVFLLANGGSVTPRLGIYAQDDYDFVEGVDKSAPVSPYCFQPGYTKVRGRVTYLPPNGNWQASLYGQNINDEVYYEICGPARSGVFDYRYGDPKMIGLEFQVFWGE